MESINLNTVKRQGVHQQPRFEKIRFYGAPNAINDNSIEQTRTFCLQVSTYGFLSAVGRWHEDVA